jgi:hypothetical protein
MSSTSLNQTGKPCPLAVELAALGRLVRHQRLECGLDLHDAADTIDVDALVLKSMEAGASTDTACLFKVLGALGRTMLVMPPADAKDALDCLGHVARYHSRYVIGLPEPRAISSPAGATCAPAPSEPMPSSAMRPANALAIDDAVIGIERFGFREPGELVEHFVLLDPIIGINDGDVLSRIAKWFADAHA